MGRQGASGPADRVGPDRTLTHVVSDHIRDMIFERRLRPGQRLVSDTLAEELGVSRVPVREALRQLDGSGLVQVRERRGAVVVSFDQSTPDELIELLQVRLHLEPWAAAEAAARHRPEHLDVLDGWLRAGSLAEDEHDLAAAGRAHHGVLQAVAAAAGNRQLHETLTPLHNRSAIAFSLIAQETLPDGWPSHLRVRDAIEQRDAPTARRETRAHLDDILRAVRRRPSVWLVDVAAGTGA